MIAVTNIETVQPVQTALQRGGSQRNGHNDAIGRQVEPTGRAVATQRDAFYFQSQAILRQGAPATAPYLAQQISQLWPTSPTPVHKTAVSAYAQTGLLFGHDERDGSVLA